MEEDLLARIRADAGLTALLGTRSYWIARPQGSSLPALVLQIVSPGRGYDHAGADGLSSPRVQFDCYGATYASAKAVARALIAAIEPSETVGDTHFVRSFLDGERNFEPQTLAGGEKVHRVSMDFFVWHTPA